MQRRTVIKAAAAAALASPASIIAAAPARKAAKAPKGFHWGTAISAHQSEGNNVNSDSWLNEHVSGTLFREPAGDACDSYDRFEEDIRIAASRGFNTHRFGIEWARIEPEPGVFSEATLDHYRRMLETCRVHGLAPIVTYNHFTVPRWYAARGGFLAGDGPELFARFAERTTAKLGALIAGATTFNEMNAPRLIPVLVPAAAKIRPRVAQMLAASARACGSDRFSSWIFADADEIERPMRKAHALAYAAIKAGPGDFPVGISLSMQELQARSGGEAKKAELDHKLYGQWMKADVPSDFVGVQTYTRILIGPEGPLPLPAGARKTDAGYEYYPPALGAMVRYAARHSGKPVIITESGISTHDDAERVAFIDACLEEVRGCLADGIDLRGYIHWSLLDNFEWTAGYTQQFGLVSVDRKTFVRTPKPSAHYLGRIARSGTV
jgi:beta-glucosidase